MKSVHAQTILSPRHSGKRKFSKNKGFPAVEWFTTVSPCNCAIAQCKQTLRFYLQTHSHRTKAKAKAKIFFGLLCLFFDFFSLLFSVNGAYRTPAFFGLVSQYLCLPSGRPMAEAGLYSQAVVVMATLVTLVTSMALPGTKEDTDINLFMPGVQPQNVSTLCGCVCVRVCVLVTVSVLCVRAGMRVGE